MSTDQAKPNDSPVPPVEPDVSNYAIVEELRKSFQPATSRLGPEVEPATILVLPERNR